MRILLDTQIFVYLSRGELDRLSSRALEWIDDPENGRLMSAVSVAELAVKASIGKFETTSEQIRAAADKLLLDIVPFTPAHASRMFGLPLLHRDPFDRMIIATALVEDVPIMTTDRVFSQYSGLRVISPAN